MNKPNLLLLGPVTKDTIRKNGTTYKNIGGATYYQSTALLHLGADVTAVVTIAPSDKALLSSFHPDTDILPVWTEQSMVFENIYPDPNNPNIRVQQASIPENPIMPSHLQGLDINRFDAIYILPLCPYDIPLVTVEYLSSFRKPVFMGAQGYLRHLQDGKVVLRDWAGFRLFAPYISMLFVDDTEARCILNISGSGIRLPEIASKLVSYGINEVVLTRGDRGAIIASGKGRYTIPAFAPDIVTDPTGLGDTYMAAYTLQRLRGYNPQQSGELAATTATMKLEYKGAFHGSFADVVERKKYVHAVEY